MSGPSSAPDVVVPPCFRSDPGADQRLSSGPRRVEAFASRMSAASSFARSNASRYSGSLSSHPQGHGVPGGPRESPIWGAAGPVPWGGRRLVRPPTRCVITIQRRSRPAAIPCPPAPTLRLSYRVTELRLTVEVAGDTRSSSRWIRSQRDRGPRRGRRSHTYLRERRRP